MLALLANALTADLAMGSDEQDALTLGLLDRHPTIPQRTSIFSHQESTLQLAFFIAV
ncbi:MAG: hypothetical protein GY770_27045 [Aestuariibacter sp.]|nr:hypothetical protein [Aestuariibacter sp.]